MGEIDRERAARAIGDFLRAIGHDPDKATELKDTGLRVTNAFIDELCKGEREDPASVVRANVIPSAGNEELVLVRDLPIATTCPHHLMPATGTATVAFRPAGKIIGIGAIGDVLEIFSRRLTLQEAIGEEVVTLLARELSPTWIGCRLALVHSCMVVRDEKRRGASVETIALRGEVEASLAYRVLGAVP